MTEITGLIDDNFSFANDTKNKFKYSITDDINIDNLNIYTSQFKKLQESLTNFENKISNLDSTTDTDPLVKIDYIIGNIDKAIDVK